MQRFHDSLESRLEPLWLAVIGGVSTLYGLWPVAYLYDDVVAKDHTGYGWFPFLIFSPIAFVIGLAITSTLLTRIFCWLENRIARIAVALLLVSAFLTAHGKPHPFGLFVVAFITVSYYFHAKRLHEDARDREEFFNE